MPMMLEQLAEAPRLQGTVGLFFVKPVDELTLPAGRRVASLGLWHAAAGLGCCSAGLDLVYRGLGFPQQCQSLPQRGLSAP